MKDKRAEEFERAFSRGMLRSMFQSLFWAVIQFKKSKGKFTQQQIADALGIDKSGVSRSLAYPSNWTIDKMSDISEALGVDIVVEARDRATGAVITTIGEKRVTSVNASSDPVITKFDVPRTSANIRGERLRKVGNWR